MKMKNLKNTGLLKPSFIRIELPIKVEKEQFLYPIGYYEGKEVEKILTKILKKMQNKRFFLVQNKDI